VAIFYVYVHDGESFTMDDMEYAPSAEIAKRQLASRVRTGKGISHFVNDMDEISPRAGFKARQEEEWPPATDEARMAVWRVKGRARLPEGIPTEVWLYSGNVDRPIIITVDEEPMPAPKPLTPLRVSEAVYLRRLKMGWDDERARSVPMDGRNTRHVTNMSRVEMTENLGAATRPRDSYTAFGISQTVADWATQTGINEAALRHGIKVRGLEEYLRKKDWYPGKRV
jgi:hypothetical protein